MSDRSKRPEHLSGQDEEVPEDDAIIGVAFRRSAVVIVVLVVVGVRQS